jgi:hypothetical protein
MGFHHKGRHRPTGKGRELKMEMIEYLFTGLIIIAILVGSSTMVTMISEPQRITSEKEQLKIVAQKLMTQLILDPGIPPDWGSQIEPDGEEIKALGLAKYSETRRDAYVLDPDKVMRLNGLLKPRRLYISPSRALELLNLKGIYGFRIELQPALNVSQVNATGSQYEIKVSTISGTPIAGANVTARMFYYDGNYNFTDPLEGGTKTTDVYGRCTFNFNMSSPRSVIFLVVDHNGIRLVKVFSAGDQVERATLIGSRILVEDKILIGEALEILLEMGDKGLDIINVCHKFNLTGVEEGIYIHGLDFLEPSMEAVLSISQDGKLYYATREVYLQEYSTVEGVGPTPFSYSLERSVIIGRSIYIVRLYVWRMSW